MKLVSVVMPTKGRSEFARQALECYLTQTYTNKELIILDDSTDPSFPQPLNFPGVTHIFRNGGSIPEKRNELARRANGEIIVNFDSDDWSHPDRIVDQVNRLEESGMPITGYTGILWYAEHCEKKRWCRYPQDPTWVGGGTMAFTKEWALAHPFNEHHNKRVGSDSELQRTARYAGELISVPGGEMVCARIHRDNTSPKMDMVHAFIAVPEPESELIKAWASRAALVR